MQGLQNKGRRHDDVAHSIGTPKSSLPSEMFFYAGPVSGRPVSMVVVLFLIGIWLQFAGILGEYSGRTSNQFKREPRAYL